MSDKVGQRTSYLPRLYVIADLDYVGDVNRWLDVLRALTAQASAADASRLMVQVRAKSLAPAAFRDAASAARQAVGSAATLVLNGDTDLACELGYDGVHWPERDMPTAPSCTLPFRSAAAHSPDAIRRAELAGATAIVFSAVFAPTWKSATAAGPAALAEAVKTTALPVYALGGVTPERVRRCRAAGAYGVAVLSGILGSDPTAAVERYLDALG